MCLLRHLRPNRVEEAEYAHRQLARRIIYQLRTEGGFYLPYTVLVEELFSYLEDGVVAAPLLPWLGLGVQHGVEQRGAPVAPELLSARKVLARDLGLGVQLLRCGRDEALEWELHV